MKAHTGVKRGWRLVWHTQIEGKLLRMASSCRWDLIFLGRRGNPGKRKTLFLLPVRNKFNICLARSKRTRRPIQLQIHRLKLQLEVGFVVIWESVLYQALKARKKGRDVHEDCKNLQHKVLSMRGHERFAYKKGRGEPSVSAEYRSRKEEVKEK